MQDTKFEDYLIDREESLSNPEAFWDKKGKELIWEKPYEKVFEIKSNGVTRWYLDGKINPSYNLLDVNIEKYKDVIYFNFLDLFSNIEYKYTYGDFFTIVKKYSNVLIDLGIKENDNLLFYFPLQSIDCLALYQACFRVGCIPLFLDIFANKVDLIEKLIDYNPKFLFTGSAKINVDGSLFYYTPIVTEALEECKKTNSNFSVKIAFLHTIYHFEKNVSSDWFILNDLFKNASDNNEGVVRNSNDIMSYVESSGSSGKQKILKYTVVGCLLTANGALVENVKFPSITLGTLNFFWISGQTINNKQIKNGSSMVIFIGQPKSYLKFVSDYKINFTGFSGSDLKTFYKLDPNGNAFKAYDLSNLKGIICGGEAIGQEIEEWVRKVFPDHIKYYNLWSQTEIYEVCVRQFKDKPTPIQGSGWVMPGYVICILDRESGKFYSDKNLVGDVFIKAPLPPTFSYGLFEDDDDSSKYAAKYLSEIKSYYSTGDYGKFDENDCLFIYGRGGDELKINKKRLSPSVIEGYINEHTEVIDSLASERDLGDYVAMVLLVETKFKLDNDENKLKWETLKTEIHKKIESNIGSDACKISMIVNVPSIPKNASGKTVRAPIREISAGKIPFIPTTVINKEIFKTIKELILQELDRQKEL